MALLSVVISTLFDLRLPSLSLSETRNTVMSSPCTLSLKVLVSLVKILPSTSISASVDCWVRDMLEPLTAVALLVSASNIFSSVVLPLIFRSLPAPVTPESITSLALPSEVLTMLAVRPKLSDALLMRLRICCSVSPFLTSTVNSLPSPALMVRVPSSVISEEVELAKVPSILLVVANLLTVTLY